MNDQLYTELQDELSLLVQAEKERKGFLGYNVGGTFLVRVPERPHRYYVRFPNSTFIEAINSGRVPPEPNRPVEIGYSREGTPYIVGDDLENIEGFLGQNRSGIGVGEHTHDFPPLLDMVSGYRFRPGLVRSIPESFAVYVEPFAYAHGGVEKFFKGGSYELGDHVPLTSGKRWAKLYLNTDTGTLFGVNGPIISLAQNDPSIEALVNIQKPVEIASAIPLGGVILKSGQTTSPEWKHYGDSRSFLSSPTVSGNSSLPDLTPNPAGTYTLATVTVDAKGRVTGASNGAGGVSEMGLWDIPTILGW